MKSPDPAPAGGLVDLSLVIATRDRAELLKRCLDSLACQQGRVGTFEVIVVDNADAPDPAVEALCRSEIFRPLSLTCLYHPERGSSGARNRGAALARGRLVGFLDDDDTLPPNWIQQALDTEAATGALIFGGPYFPTYASPKPAWFKDEYASGEWGSQPRWLEERRYLFAANLVIEKELFQKLGGFSLELGPGTANIYGEETDLQHRAARQGVRIWYEPALLVYHHTFPEKMTADWFLNSSRQKGKAKARIFQEDFSTRKVSKTRQQFNWARQALGKAIEIVLLYLKLPFRSRKKYPYDQNYIIECICPNVSNLAMLTGLARGRAKNCVKAAEG